MNEIMLGILIYYIIGTVVVGTTYTLRKDAVRIVKEQSDFFPPPTNAIVFYFLTALLITLFPLVLITQIVHIIRKNKQ